MIEQRAFVVVNPVAGMGDAQTLIEALEAHLTVPAWSYECYRTTKDRYFVLNISAGLSAKMMRDAGRGEKRVVGQLAYLWSGVEELTERLLATRR